MEFSQIVFLLCATILALCVTAGSAIKCYECNSASQYSQAGCDDPFSFNSDYLVDCQDESSTNNASTHCRKQVQSVGGDYRIVRSCAYEVPKSMGCVERAGTKEIALTYCECEGESCNSATSTTVNVFMVAVVSAFLALLIQS